MRQERPITEAEFALRTEPTVRLFFSVDLDYLDAESIKNKAHRLLGQMFGVKSVVQDNHRLYLLVGEPQLKECKASAQRYLNLLYKELPLPTEIVREAEAEAFSREFAQKIEEHRRAVG